jgi:putative transcriptional regulator
VSTVQKKRKAKMARREPVPENMFEVALEEVRAIRRGEIQPRIHEVYVPPAVNVAAVRATTGLGQVEFAAKYGFSLAAVRKWEQGTREPEPAARTLLHMIALHPKAVSKMIAEVAENSAA